MKAPYVGIRLRLHLRALLEPLDHRSRVAPRATDDHQLIAETEYLREMRSRDYVSALNCIRIELFAKMSILEGLSRSRPDFDFKHP